ncbi:SURP and G-patch domain-containing protein 1-like [Watersipora subatra]|uniref:SURP and G-patch domain-containing protein 1-like n=1 Tax=Watersipora subatra TaxID=2589382 RepID=UPI00355B5117
MSSQQSNAGGQLPISLKNDGSFLEQFKRMQEAQKSQPNKTATLNTAHASAPPPPPTAPLPVNLKNDGSFLEQFKKTQQQSTPSTTVKTEPKDRLNMKAKHSLQARFLMTPKRQKPSTQMTEVFDLDYDLSLTEDEQTLIDQIAEQVVNGGPTEEMKIKAQSLSNGSLRFLREPQTEGGRYYIRQVKRKHAKRAEAERIRREEMEKAERERLAQERLKLEQEEDADAESDDEKDEQKRAQKRSAKKRSADAAAVKDPAAELKAFQEKIRQQTAQIAAAAKKSRWGPSPTVAPAPPIAAIPAAPVISHEAALARQVTGGELSEEQKKQLEYQRQMNEMYDMITKKKQAQQDLEKALNSGKPAKGMYAYDSDEDTEGGTWEHKLRKREMAATRDWADELTKQNRGKHHMGDFLPPDELAKFMETYQALKEGREPDLSDYKEFKITCENIGYKMLMGMGWEEGSGLGPKQQGITAPVNKGQTSLDGAGVGVDKPHNLTAEDDEFEAYRKRMMLAYRFRPNPLNNPRRAYY